MKQFQQSQSHYMGGMGSTFWPGAGNVYYLDGVAGLNANSGLTPSAPKLTLTAALALCTNDADDYILVKDYWQPAGETWPVVVNKSKVHIVCVRSGSYRPWAAAAAPADTAVLSIAANDVRIDGFYFDAGATHGAIEFTGNCARVGIYNCYFGTGAYGILDEAGGIEMGLEIAGCYFQQSLTAGGIYLNDDGPFNRIHDNVFDQIAGEAINVATGGAPQIYNNLIACGSDTEGLGITLGAGVTRALVMNNSANFGNADMVANPFQDDAAEDVNHWANNMWGITLAHTA